MPEFAWREIFVIKWWWVQRVMVELNDCSVVWFYCALRSEDNKIREWLGLLLFLVVLRIQYSSPIKVTVCNNRCNTQRKSGGGELRGSMAPALHVATVVTFQTTCRVSNSFPVKTNPRPLLADDSRREIRVELKIPVRPDKENARGNLKSSSFQDMAPSRQQPCWF